MLSTQQKLDDAQLQYHLLVTGRQANVFVDMNGERVQFTTANRQDLQAYISQLQAELAGQTTGPSAARPLGFLF